MKSSIGASIGQVKEFGANVDWEVSEDVHQKVTSNRFQLWRAERAFAQAFGA